MKKITTIILLLSVLLIAGCITTSSPKVCTEDAKICPDGTSVGRDSNNNCEFFECSDEKPIPVEPDGGIGLTNPYIRYVGYDRTQCAATDWMCIEGSSQFFDDTGCGCKADEPKKYISKDIDECVRIKYLCENNFVPFSDDTGCGCEFTFESAESGNSIPTGKLKAMQCTPEMRAVDVCTEEYNPVCGWSDPAKIQCIKYPCADNYSNACEACKDEKVGYYTLGNCPTEDSEILK